MSNKTEAIINSKNIIHINVLENKLLTLKDILFSNKSDSLSKIFDKTEKITKHILSDINEDNAIFLNFDKKNN